MQRVTSGPGGQISILLSPKQAEQISAILGHMGFKSNLLHDVYDQLTSLGIGGIDYTLVVWCGKERISNEKCLIKLMSSTTNHGIHSVRSEVAARNSLDNQ